MRQALAEAGPVLLEPVMAVEVVLPEEYLGEVIADINAKRGRVQGMESTVPGRQAVRAHVPLAEMFGYATDLRSATQGRASYTMQFHRYELVPDKIAETIIRKVRGIL